MSSEEKCFFEMRNAPVINIRVIKFRLHDANPNYSESWQAKVADRFCGDQYVVQHQITLKTRYVKINIKKN